MRAAKSWKYRAATFAVLGVGLVAALPQAAVAQTTLRIGMTADADLITSEKNGFGLGRSQYSDDCLFRGRRRSSNDDPNDRMGYPGR